MMQTPSAHSYQLNMKLGKQMPTTNLMTSTLMSNSSRKTSCSDNASDIVDADYVDKNIPKMELLKISYVSRSRNSLTANNDDSDVVQLRAKKRIHPRQPLYQRSHSDGLLKVSELAKLSGCNNDNSKEHNSSSSKTKTTTTTTTTTANSKGSPTKSQPLPMPSHHQNPLKYTVYKKHNSCDTTAALKSEKLQYTNDDAIFKAKKKYSMFDGRKRNSIDNIQFYFDSKSYERHVDNKIYGVLMPNANTSDKAPAKASVKRLAPAVPPPNYENKSNSWNFVKATKSLLHGANSGSRNASGQKYTKNVPSAKKMSRDSSLVDLTRIGQLFRETRRASADDLLDGGRIPICSEIKSRTTSENNESDNKTASTSKKIKKLSTDFENKCLCDYKPKQLREVNERKKSAPSHLFSDAGGKFSDLNRLNENCMRSRRKLEFPVMEPDSGSKSDRSPPTLPPKKTNRMVKCNSAEYDDATAQKVDKGFYLLDKTRSKSVSIEHGVPLFGQFNSKCNGSPSTCGYKNCTFINCPMSSITAALSNVNREQNSEKICSKASINSSDKEQIHEKSSKLKNGHNISITKIDTISNKSKLYLKTKDFNDDDDEFLKDFELNGDGVTLNNLKNLKNTTNLNVNSTNACPNNGGTTIPIKFMPNQQNLNNSMKCKSVEKLDFNSTSTIENKKFNNALSTTEKVSFSKNEDDNRVKIFIRATASNSPIYETSSSADSVSDYYDSVPNECDTEKKPTADSVSDADEKCNIVDFGITPTTNLLTPTSLQHSQADLTMGSSKSLKNLFPSRLGCDGAIFWNDCFYYDEHACCNCKSDSDKVSNLNEMRSSSGSCTCSRNRSSTNSSGGDAEDDDDLEVDGSSSRPQSMEGPMDSGISLNGDTISSPDSDNSSQHHIQNQSDIESRKSRRGHVLAELLETERIYVAEMGSILRGYRDQIHSEEMASLVPPGLHGKEDILFGNLNELYTFHSEVFLKDLENCISTTELVALCFVQRRDTFYRLYSFYCQNIPRSERLRETLVDTHLFLQECQKRLGHKLPLAAYLLKPVQRITKYQLLLKDLLRFSDNGTCAKELQKALDCMLIVLKCVNDSMHQIAITGFPADLTQQGELLLQDSFQVWTESKKDIRLRLKTQQRHIFLYQKAMLFCKQASKTGHTKSTYQFKHYVKMSQIGLTESVRGDARRFEVWLQGRQEVHTIQATTVEIKNKWVAEIKKVLLNQLEELKDEKIKQYSLSHSANPFRPLRQTVSWDTPNAMQTTPQRAMSIDTNSTNSNETNRCSNISDESGPITTPAAPISSSSSEHDNHEAGHDWSSDYSNSEDEYPNAEDTALDVWSVFTAPFQQKQNKSSDSRSSLPALPSLPSSIIEESQHKSNSTFYVSVED
ncbi:serine-rich adhesin for platelets isoform X2 [Sitodiplosis mosellana]|uniref:serine-rich adhesin for platelets isoform X2 n=1 Tax=Sitodiplosis mosellana TaxID=263140 RepID=UPI002443E238|nr:serine-rich adhesin for platelets isoform X2 [Sitodiplosis mosellana]